MRFLFEERDARDLAAMRITLGLLLLAWWLALWPDLTLWFSDRGPVDTELLDTNWSIYRSHFLDGLSDGQLQAVHVAGLVAILAFTVGFGTPLMNIVIVFLLAAYWHRSPWIQNGGDRLLRIFTFYMLFTDSGRAWSVDARLRGATDATAPVFSMRLIQLQLIVMYTYTGIAKCSGFTWLDGSAIYYSLSDIGYSRFPALTDAILPLKPVRAVLALLTWITLVWEVFFAPLVIWRRTRMATLIVGVLVHVGIFGLLAVGIFSWSTLWGYLAFLPSGWAVRLVDGVKARLRGPQTA
ncbi:MAG: HTTM domain-containing protein [Alphaproteobacteria bacterium]|nr:HTTM domain-containing protein [Alphaproteobacteria bacterium]